ncbi:NADP-dependent malic enzyme [Woeseia oceani]|uniref:NADP-dependent malic enzyme n=1 Tax=Woeseia oceani TaxID=1548547 RepID=A0A193LCM1_9GAMM|nr:NADP-dependent malic enzyme [Woeseia oceani]ANO50257.1 malic enzyme [Woeseia oceani]
MSDPLEEASLRYHERQPAGKITVTPTKPLTNQLDLAQAYSPGVAFPCMRIKEDPTLAAKYTARGNLVGVISNGSAVLGLGAIGPLAAKPVMEGKSVLFKKFAGIDAFDIEVDENDPDKLVETISRLEPTFGAINLEDIKAPECFIVEEKLDACMNIPVFHDDQHGTAIVVSAAIKNGLKIVGKNLEDIKVVSTGGGAASLSCLDLLVKQGLPMDNITLCDLHGVVYASREADMNPYKSRFARDTELRNLDEAIAGADVFLGLSAPNVLSADMVKKMADRPLILALANPTPEILPEVAIAARPDAIIATGRSDYPNQVNNVLCFPFIFRGALDVGATKINDAMKIACVDAIANLAQLESTDEVANAYQGEELTFGPEYVIPKPFDLRLMEEVSLAVARAAMESGVATRPIADLDAYRNTLRSFSHRSFMFMQPVIDVAKRDTERLAYAEGENEVVLRAVQTVIDERIAFPVVIGRASVVDERISRLGLRMRAGQDFELVDPENDPRYRDYWQFYHSRVCRKGVSVSAAKTLMRTNSTVIAACMVAMKQADALLCGTIGRFDHHLQDIIEIIGSETPNHKVSSMSVLFLPDGPLFISDAFISVDPGVEQLVAMTLASAERVQSFGIKPKIALLSHSNFGSSAAPSARKMRDATRIIKERAPHLEVDGEMHALTAMNESIRKTLDPSSPLTDRANLLIMPNLDTANIAMELIRSVTDALFIGPILSGTAMPAHIVTPSMTAKGIFNMSAIAVADAWQRTHDD